MIKKLHVDYSGNSQSLEFFYIERDPYGGKQSYAAPIQMVPYDSGAYHPIKPFFSVKDDDHGMLQVMFDALWRLGIRPTDLGTIDSTLAAKDKHLEDLRKIAFHALKVPSG